MTNTDPQEDTVDHDQPLTWATAQTLDQLGELTARWLEGAIPNHPANHGEGPDEETHSLVPTLAAYNRAGLVTDFSQPGEPESDGWTQRAAVSAWCSDETCDRLDKAIGPTELILLFEIHGRHSCSRIPVTLDEGKAYTWTGNSYDEDYLMVCYGELAPEGRDAIRASWYVTIIDPIWGRNDLLWPTVAAALGLTTQ